MMTWMSRPSAPAAVSTSFDSGSLSGVSRLMSIAMVRAEGTNSRSSSSRFAPSATVIRLAPVTLPPGRLKLATKPNWTGSPALTNTIGMVAVAALAARTETMPPVATSNETLRRTRSSASACSRSYWPSAQRYSVATVWLSS